MAPTKKIGRMSAVVISIITGAIIVVAILVITPLLNVVPKITDHLQGLILLAAIFIIIGAIFGSYHGYSRALEQDGFLITAGSLRRILPADIGLPTTVDELIRLLDHHNVGTPKGHLEQALENHARGNWAAANGQLRTFFDALLDDVAEQLDRTAANLSSGQARRSKLASLGFLSVPLNVWDDDGEVSSTVWSNGCIRKGRILVFQMMTIVPFACTSFCSRRLHCSVASIKCKRAPRLRSLAFRRRVGTEGLDSACRENRS